MSGITESALFAQDRSSCTGPQALERSLASQPSVTTYNLLGVYFAKHNQIQCALVTFEQALQMDPASWESHYNLGLALLSSGRNKEAVPQLQSALARDPGNAGISMALGSAFDRLNDPENAIKQYRLILKGDPHSVPAFTAIGNALIAARRYNAAINWLKGSSDERAQRLLADGYEKNNDPKEAIQTLQSILSSRPSDFQAHRDLGAILQREADYGGAAEEFRKAMDLDPSDEYARISYLDMLVILQQYATARPLASALLQKRPHDFSVLYLDGLIERDLGDDVAAEPHLREAVALNPGSYEAHYTLGFVLERRGKAAQAAEQMQLALELNPHSTEARFQLGRILRSLGQQDEAYKQFDILKQEKQKETRKAVAGDKASLGDQALKAGETVKAISLYREAIDEDPDDFHTYYSLALALSQNGEFKAEREALKHSLERNEKFAPAHNQLGYLDMQEGDFANAESEFKSSTIIDPQYAEADNNLGVLYGKLGRKNEAKRLFLRATENNPQYAQAFVNLGLVLASESNFPEANLVLQDAVKIAPHDPAALNAQKMIQMHLEH